MKTPLDIVIIGCGSRGRNASDMIEVHPELGRVVAIADPLADRRARIGGRHQVPESMRFNSWQELFAKVGKAGDLLINTTMDREHVASAIKAMELGYHMLLEKPMACTLEDCVAIDNVRQRTHRIVAVCHGMRYSGVYQKVKEIIDAGTLGKLVSLDQLEGVDPQHQSHSFVRGNWGNEGRSTFMLLAKSCHDIDSIAFLMGENAIRVSSFGDLFHFKKADKPQGAPARCVEGCPVGDDCPYNAVTLYKDGREDGYGAWIGLHEKTQEQRDQFLLDSPWAKCVYDTDNDVVDHQVVAMQFPSGATATFTMTAFAPAGRRLRVHGTKGYLEAFTEDLTIKVTTFWGKQDHTQEIKVDPQSGSHGGADYNVVSRLVEAIQKSAPKLVLTGTDESLRTHAVVFAAEKSRRTGQTVEVSI